MEPSLKQKELNSKIKNLQPGQSMKVKTIGDLLREDQKRDREEKLHLLLKCVCGLLVVGYLIWITIETINLLQP